MATPTNRTATSATLALCQFFLIDQIDMVAEPAHSKRSETRKIRNKAYKVSNQSLDRDRAGRDFRAPARGMENDLIEAEWTAWVASTPLAVGIRLGSLDRARIE